VAGTENCITKLWLYNREEKKSNDNIDTEETETGNY